MNSISGTPSVKRWAARLEFWAMLVASSCWIAAARGSDPPRVPTLTGERAATARQLAGLAGCELVVGEFFIAPANWRDDLLPDVVYMQSPQPLTPVKPGAVLAGWTFRKAAADQRVVTVPDLRKLSWEEARERLAELKLPLLRPPSGPNSPEAADAPVAGTVQDQYPQPAQKILEGTAVYLLTGE